MYSPLGYDRAFSLRRLMFYEKLLNSSFPLAQKIQKITYRYRAKEYKRSMLQTSDKLSVNQTYT